MRMLAHAGDGRREARGADEALEVREGAIGFDLKIVLVTVLPWVLVLALALTGTTSLLIDVPLVLLAAPHVLVTPAMFFQTGLRPHVVANRRFYVLAPIVTIGGGVALFVFAPADVAKAALLGFALWQIHHFTKQNLGMFSFWTKARGISSPTGAERKVIQWTAVIGMAGIIRLADLTPLVTTLAEMVGVATIVVLAAASIWVAHREGGARTAALLASVVFYAPVLVFNVGFIAALLAYQAAHGAQYYLMVGTATRPTGIRLAAVALLLLVFGPVFAYSGIAIDPYGSDAWMVGAYKGVISWHFLADSRLWRLRDPQVRGFMKQRFAFL
jgi:hypothetical protein